MGLFVSTVSATVDVPELGISVTHPTVDRELSAQFTSEEIKLAATLTSAIRAGSLSWKKTSGGSAEPALDYDEDYLEVERENLGVGLQDDRAVTFKDLGIAEGKARYVVICGYDANASGNKGTPMEFFFNNGSDDVPFAPNEDMVITGFSIKTSGLNTGTMTFYIDGSPINTLTLSSAEKNSKKSLSHDLLELHELSVIATSGTFTRPNVYIFLKVK